MHLFLWILSVLFSLAIGYWTYVADKKRDIPKPWLTALLRTLLLLLTCILLLSPSVTIEKQETQKPVLVFLQDNSFSLTEALKGDSQTYKKNAADFLEKLSKEYRVVKWGFGVRIQPDTLFQYHQQATDISRALNQATEFYGQQNLGAIILASDGKFNQGHHPGYLDIPFQGSLYAVALGDSTKQQDIRIGQVYANKTVTLNSQFEIRADLLADKSIGYNKSILLKEINGSASGASAVTITTDQFDKSVSFLLKAEEPGLHHYVIYAPEMAGESNTTNNRKDVFVEVVREKKNILIAAYAPHPDIHVIREALTGLERFNVEVRTADQLPASFANYHVVILHSLPSQQYPLPQLASSKKPVWYILGSATNPAALNQVQNLAKLDVNPGVLQNLFAALDPAFLEFNLPPSIQAVMDKMPPLAVPAGTIQASPDGRILFFDKSGRQPLWMISQGAVPTALLAGEGLWRWRLAEYRHFNTHQVIDETIRQTVSLLASGENEKPFRTELPKYIWSDQETITIQAFLLNANKEQVNNPDVQLTLTDSSGKKEEYSFEKSGNAYKLNLGLRSAGTYSYFAKASFDGNTYTHKGSFSVQRIPLELMESGADYPLLFNLAKKYNGSLFSGNEFNRLYDSILQNPHVKPVIQTTTTNLPLVDWKWYFFLILVLAVAEWLLRKYWLAQ